MSAASGGGVTVGDLRRVHVLEDLGDDDLAWIAARTELVELAPGDVLFRAGDPPTWMYLVVEGTLHARREGAAAAGLPWVIQAGEVSGMIPFSRMREIVATGHAVTHARVGRYPAAGFPELLTRIPILERRLVGVLADRVRESTQLEQQREKLAALGKLSAGLAHELNNPAAAVRRTAADLRARIDTLAELTAALCDAGVGGAALAALQDVRRSMGARAGAPPVDPLARADQEEEMARWLEGSGVGESWALAATFVDAGMSVAQLSATVANVPAPARASALAWVEAAVAVDGLLRGIEHASARIADLVGAVKSYTRMDRGSGTEQVDVRKGLESTLAIFAHRLKEKRVVLAREIDADLPAVQGHAGELNQVWTNLIDNAIDALPPGGHLTVRATRERGAVRVEVHDDGPGIAPENLDRVWEPFFTTKDVGEGTGLGLDIALSIVTRRHGGELQVSSVPGDTCFWVRLPVGGVPVDGPADGGAPSASVPTADASSPPPATATGVGGGVRRG
jgi:signal transduction histidine kinase